MTYGCRERPDLVVLRAIRFPKDGLKPVADRVHLFHDDEQKLFDEIKTARQLPGQLDRGN